MQTETAGYVGTWGAKNYYLAGEWQSKHTPKGLIEAAVVRNDYTCQTNLTPTGERTESSFGVVFRGRPHGQDPKMSFREVASVEAGAALIAEQFAKIG